MSSYDVGVWFSPVDLSSAQAADYYDRLGRTVVVVERRPEFDAFVRELTARFPDRVPDAAPLLTDAVPFGLLTTWDDLKGPPPAPPTPSHLTKRRTDEVTFEASPWAGSLSVNGDTTQLPFRWSRADDAVPVVVAMARHHGLTVYDPQTGEVTNADAAIKQDAAAFLTVHLTLRLQGQPPTVDTTLLHDGRTVLHTICLDRAAAHATARRVALERRERAYEVVDPRSLAQGTRFVPVADGDDGASSLTTVLDRLRARGIDLQANRLQGPDGPVK